MKDKLEKFIEEHRDDFDAYEPPAHMWASIDKQLKQKQARIPVFYYPLAASVLLVIGAFGWFMWHGVQKTVLPVNTEVVVIPEIKEAEVYYTSIVETKRSELKQFDKDFPGLFKDFNGEMDTLHVLYGQLQIEYINSNGNAAVVQAMIENLKIQVQLLNKQIEIIQQVTQKGNKKNTNSHLM